MNFPGCQRLLETAIASILLLGAPSATLASDNRPISRDLPSIHAIKLDRYGGCITITGKRTGFFHIEKLDDRWLWITPEGHGFVPIGVSIVGMQPTPWTDILISKH